MRLIDTPNQTAYLDCVADLIHTPQVQSMRQLPHHPGVSCYEHSVFVSYVAYRLARRWGLDARSCARCGLLHDLYLYRWNDQSAHPGLQCFDHPEFALRNAEALTTLTDKERNAILAHMWPLALHLPRSREAWTISLADKLCATVETVQLWKKLKLREVLTAA
ncbi:MAG: HD domain-containing protein [Oscillospiraceae bacterium]|nr:HD domain-containing protein [Oscillospiraceae bacterium]